MTVIISGGTGIDTVGSNTVGVVAYATLVANFKLIIRTWA